MTSRDRPIFVLGCPRSGTTMFQLMLHAHPRIALPPENRFLLPTYFGRREFGDLREEENRRKLARSITRPRRTRFRDLGLRPKKTVGAIAAGPPTVGSALGIILRAYAERFDKPRWGDKRPGYHQFIPVLRRMFPDAQFVQLVRDGRDCVASLKRMPWWQRDTCESITAWMRAVKNAEWSARALPAGTFHEVRYESLVAEPEKELRKLCEFLGEEYDDAMLSPKAVADVAVPEYKTWHTRTHQDVSAAAIGRWEDDLEPWELQLCEAVMGERLRHYGYQLTGTARPDRQHLQRYRRTYLHRSRQTLQRKAIDRLKLLTERQPVTDLHRRER